MIFFRPPTTLGTIEALSIVYRAVRIWRFYPKGHPTRKSSLDIAHQEMLRLLDGNTLHLACGRTGFSFPDGESIKDATSGQAASLAFELFIRRVQKITFSYDLFHEDLMEFLKIMTLSHDTIRRAGGFDTIMAERGIRSIWVNEFDLTVIHSKRILVEHSGVVPLGLDAVEIGIDGVPLIEIETSEPDSLTPEVRLRTLIDRLTDCVIDDTYLVLTRQAVTCVDAIQINQCSNLLFQLVALLARHTIDEERSEQMKEFAQFAIEQIISHDQVLQLLLEQAGRENKISNETLFAILKAGGATAIKGAVEMMAHTDNLKTRKLLSTTMGKLGKSAVPLLINLMQDSRWFITRNICAILGAIASYEALEPLVECLSHSDLRVRKETIRSLAQIGGHEAENSVLRVLRGNDVALHPQAIASLGGMKSRLALVELMKIVCLKDMFLKSLTLKIDALAAIALIGDKQVTPVLARLIDERYLLSVKRARQLKIAIADCLGKIGDARALPVLNKLASDTGELAAACSDAIALIENTEGTPNGIS
jgi:HEAT repeat protein